MDEVLRKPVSLWIGMAIVMAVMCFVAYRFREQERRNDAQAATIVRLERQVYQLQEYTNAQAQR